MNAPAPETPDQPVATELVAVLVAVTCGQPRVLVIEDARALPSGPFGGADRSLQASLRAWVEEQTHHPLGYIEQLYTFADRDRVPGRQVISISYLGLTREGPVSGAHEAGWRNWYAYFPWEDHRAGVPAALQLLQSRLEGWAAGRPGEWRQRVAVSFGLDGHRWNDEFILQRYELLFEAGLVPEAAAFISLGGAGGQAMRHDHRRILATAIARLRAKIRYRPVVFELMPPEFTLLQLQHGVEAVAGRLTHKQNFRRLVEQQELVEETGALSVTSPGRPAKLFRFRRDILAERAVAGTKPPGTSLRG